MAWEPVVSTLWVWASAGESVTGGHVPSDRACRVRDMDRKNIIVKNPVFTRPARFS